MRSRPESKMRNRHRQLLVFAVLLVFLPSFTVSESCLPSWFRQTRSAAEPLESPTETAQKSLETNEIGEDPPAVITSDNDSDSDNTDFPIPDEDTIDRKDEVPPTLPPLQKPDDSGDSDKEKDEKLQNVVKELAKKEAEYEYEYEEEKSEEEAGEALKYNEKATKEATATLKPAVRKEIEKLKEAKCRDYCKHNATCHVEVIFRDDHVSAVVPSCHCPHGWEGTRCDRHYVQAFYAPVSGRYNQSSSSAVPAFAFLVIMLIMFIAIVVYAYRRMSKRTDDATYTMSHMCPPEAFTVLKTPNGRKISVHQCSAAAQTPPTATVIPVTPGPSSSAQRLPIRQAAVRSNEKNSSARNNFFSILRSQGTIPSRSINEDDTPKHYKSVPRVEVSAINYSGHIDFSGISFQSTESEVSKASATCPPPPAPPPQPAYFVIQMEQKEDMETNFRSPSRSSGEPGSPSTCEPMIPLKSPL